MFLTWEFGMPFIGRCILTNLSSQKNVNIDYKLLMIIVIVNDSV